MSTLSRTEMVTKQIGQKETGNIVVPQKPRSRKRQRCLLQPKTPDYIPAIDTKWTAKKFNSHIDTLQKTSAAIVTLRRHLVCTSPNPRTMDKLRTFCFPNNDRSANYAHGQTTIHNLAHLSIYDLTAMKSE